MEKKYLKPQWACYQTTRATGLIEDVCECGIGHPNKEWIAEHDPTGKKGLGIHGCCGCCQK